MIFPFLFCFSTPYGTSPLELTSLSLIHISSDVQKVVILSDKIRKAGNELVGLMRKNYDQLMRTKKYRKLLKLYGSTKDKKKHRDLANQLNEIQKQYNVTWRCV